MRVKSQGTQLIFSLLFGSLGALYIGFAEFLLSLIAFSLMHFVFDFNIFATHLIIATLNAYTMNLRNKRVKNEFI